MLANPVYTIKMLKNRFYILIVLFVYSLNLYAQSSLVIHKLIKEENYSQALVQIDQKLIKNSNDRDLLYLKAQSEFKLNRNSQAIKTYQRIIQLYPAYPDAYNNLAGIYAKQGNLQLAKQILEKGMKTNKSYALLHSNINSIYLELARESYVKALQLGVKKHNVNLSVATMEQSTISNKSKESAPMMNASLNTKIVNSSTIAKQRKPNKNTKVDTQPKALKTQKTIPIVVKKKVVIKAWNEAVISSKDEVITALQGWAAAWSAQDVNLYLSFYNTQFTPENGTARHIWVSQRQSRLLKPRWIEVRLSNFSFEEQAENKAIVSVTQMYRSNSFRDKSKKKFLLKRSNDGWQILNEISL